MAQCIDSSIHIYSSKENIKANPAGNKQASHYPYTADKPRAYATGPCHHSNYGKGVLGKKCVNEQILYIKNVIILRMGGLLLKKSMLALVIICVFCVSTVSLKAPAAGAAPVEPTLETVNVGLVGWERWNPEKYNHYRLYCPDEGATVEDIFFYINKLISENMGMLNERYGASGYNPSSIHLIFDWPKLGNHPEEAYAQLAQYLYSAKTYYNGTPIEFMVWNNTGLSDKDKGVSQIEVALTNNKSTSWADHRYNPAIGAYERTDVEFYDALNEILEYNTYGTRTGSWVQNGTMLYSWNMYRLMNVYIIRSEFEIFDAGSFDRTILDQPYTKINSPGKTEGNYVLVKHLSLIDIEPAVYEKISDLCEKAKKASDSQTGQLKYINDYLCRNVKYDYDFYEWIMSGHKAPYDSKNGVVPNNAYGALVDGLAICSGFSHAVAEACNYLGIPNFYIDNESHVWNMVYIDNKWKMLDVTWNATGNDTSEYFLVEDITESSGAHTCDLTEVQAGKEDTLAYWNLKNTCDKYFEYNTEHQKIINSLVDAGIFVGDAEGELNLHNGLTRAELATLLTRLSGQENQVKEKSEYYATVSPFMDVPTWAISYVGYCYEQGLLKGYSDTFFGADDTVNVKMACTVILRYLGYSETDWGYDSSVKKAKAIGIMPDCWPTGTIALRNDIAIMINYALRN